MPTPARPRALTTPSVTVWFRENGLPMAITHSATFNLDESPQGTTGRFVASTFSNAKSVHESTPTILARNSRRSPMATVTSALFCPTTWLFVTT